MAKFCVMLGLFPFTWWESYWQVAFKIIEEELGQPLEALFSKISSQTIAAASLGQVYRATLSSSGEDVAIKVLELLPLAFVCFLP